MAEIVLKLGIKSHDLFVRYVLEDLCMAIAFFARCLPKDVVAELDLRRLAHSNAAFVSEELRFAQADMLFEVPLKRDGKTKVFLLLEHKSTRDPRTSMQLHNYMASVWRNALGNRGRSRLPVVVPVVLYHGREPWGGGGFRDLFEPAPGLERYALDFPIELCDLHGDPLDDLEGEPKLATFLNALKHSRSSELAERLPHMLRLLADVHGTASGDAASIRKNAGFMHAVVEYLSEVGVGIDLTAMKDAVERHLPGEIGDSAMATIAETLREEGREEVREKAREEARKEVREEARIEARQDILRNLLNQRFGAVPHWANAHIGRAETDQLDDWISRTVAAGSPEEVFRPVG